MKNSGVRRTAPYLLLGVLSFIFLLVFFTRIHPIGVFDGDDWAGIALVRDAVPSSSSWNPTRVFPELAMPAVGFLAAYFVTPLVGDYLQAITLTYGFVLSACICAYLLLFFWFARNEFRLMGWRAFPAAVLFLTAHFWMLRSSTEGNAHLFLARNLTCYFYYTIPSLCGGMLVLLLERRPDLWRQSTAAAKGLLALAVYLAINSNLFSSIVLIAYCGTVLLQRFIWPVLRKKTALKSALRENGFYAAAVAVWLCSLVLEVRGGRAGSVGTSGGISGITAAARNLAAAFGKLNKFFALFTVGTCVLAAAVFLRRRKKRDEKEDAFLARMFRFFLAGAVTALYQVLLCGVTGLSSYLTFADVQISIFFFLLLFLFSAVSYLMETLPVYETVLPLVLCFALFNCNRAGATYRDAYQEIPNANLASAVSRSVYQQIQEADQSGLQEMELYVPVFESYEDNFPLPAYVGAVLSRTLYEHGQISNPINITVVPTRELNVMLGLEESDAPA